MKVVDVNLLVHAVNLRASQHEAAKAWLDDALAANEPVGFAWVALLGFLRISTHASILPRPLDIPTAVSVCEVWLAQTPAVMVHPTTRHLAVLTGFLSQAGRGGSLVTDVHLAALAVEHGAELVTFDRDFGRFPGLSWRLLDTT